MTAPAIEEMTPRKLFDIGEDDRLPTNVRREVIAAAAIWASALKQLETARLLYNGLLMAVETKHEGESRHETALRYIMQAEWKGDGVAQLPPAPGVKP